jgi:hypothetical protein
VFLWLLRMGRGAKETRSGGERGREDEKIQGTQEAELKAESKMEGRAKVLESGFRLWGWLAMRSNQPSESMAIL